MAQESFQERTEQATPKRRREAREKGQVAKSKEISSLAVLLAGTLTLSFGSGFFYHHISELMRYYLSNVGSAQVTQANMTNMALVALRYCATILAPLFIILVSVAFLANYLQVGSLLSFEAIKPNFSKINPLEGLKRLFSTQAAMELAKSILKLIVVSWIAYVTINGELKNLPSLLDFSPGQIQTYLFSITGILFKRTCMVMLILAVLDYLFQRWEFEKNLKMTKQEVKEEMKQTEGDPHVKARIRSIQREAAKKRMMADVPKADVVITNPTRLAVALRYDSAEMDAPMVIAKGSGHVAERIKEIAQENGVPVIENKPLAQSLYKMVEIGRTIPETLYKAAAEVLAYVYKQKGRRGHN